MSRVSRQVIRIICRDSKACSCVSVLNLLAVTPSVLYLLRFAPLPFRVLSCGFLRYISESRFTLSLSLSLHQRFVPGSGLLRLCPGLSMKLFARTLTLLTFAFAPSRALQLIGAGAMQAAAAPPRLQHLSLAWCMQAAVAPIAQLCFPLPPAAVWLLEPLLFFHPPSSPLCVWRCAAAAPALVLAARAALVPIDNLSPSREPSPSCRPRPRAARAALVPNLPALLALVCGGALPRPWLSSAALVPIDRPRASSFALVQTFALVRRADGTARDLAGRVKRSGVRDPGEACPRCRLHTCCVPTTREVSNRLSLLMRSS